MAVSGAAQTIFISAVYHDLNGDPVAQATRWVRKYE